MVQVSGKKYVVLLKVKKKKKNPAASSSNRPQIRMFLVSEHENHGNHGHLFPPSAVPSRAAILSRGPMACQAAMTPSERRSGERGESEKLEEIKRRVFPFSFSFSPSLCKYVSTIIR